MTEIPETTQEITCPYCGDPISPDDEDAVSSTILNEALVHRDCCIDADDMPYWAP